MLPILPRTSSGSVFATPSGLVRTAKHGLAHVVENVVLVARAQKILIVQSVSRMLITRMVEGVFVTLIGQEKTALSTRVHVTRDVMVA